MFEVDAVVQARLDSSRFPGKVLKPFLNTTVLGHLLEQLLDYQGFRRVILSTTARECDLPVVDFASKYEVDVHQGSMPPADVLSRFADAAKLYDCKMIARFTADNPIINRGLLNSAFLKIKSHHARQILISSRGMGFSEGMDIEWFSRELLNRADASATSFYDREHVTPWMYRQKSVETILIASAIPSQRSSCSFSIDYPEDLPLVQSYAEFLEGRDHDEELAGRFFATRGN